MCLAQGPQRSDAGEARTRCPLVPSQALYHWATALPSSIEVGVKHVQQISQLYGFDTCMPLKLNISFIMEARDSFLYIKK